MILIVAFTFLASSSSFDLTTDNQTTSLRRSGFCVDARIFYRECCAVVKCNCGRSWSRQCPAIFASASPAEGGHRPSSDRLLACIYADAVDVGRYCDWRLPQCCVARVAVDRNVARCDGHHCVAHNSTCHQSVSRVSLRFVFVAVLLYVKSKSNLCSLILR